MTRNLPRASKADSATRSRDVLELLAQLVPQLARSIGPDCEVVLHDNREAPPRILAIGNGHVTRRGVGDLMTRISIGDMEMHDLREPLYNYDSVTPDGRQLRVSLIPVIVEGETVAYFAINFMIGDLVMAQRALAQLTRTEQRPDEIHETFQSSLLPLRFVIERCLKDFPCPPHLLSREERIALVGRLRSDGAFRLRGAVREIAARLGISRAAIYNYVKLAPKAAGTRRGGVAAGAAQSSHSQKGRLP